MGRDILYEFGCKARLANVAHAKHHHQLTTLLDQRAIELSQLLFAADEAAHIRRLTPILAPFARWRGRDGTGPLGKQRGEPLFVEWSVRAGRFALCRCPHVAYFR